MALKPFVQPHVETRAAERSEGTPEDIKPQSRKRRGSIEDTERCLEAGVAKRPAPARWSVFYARRTEGDARPRIKVSDEWVMDFVRGRISMLSEGAHAENNLGALMAQADQEPVSSTGTQRLPLDEDAAGFNVAPDEDTEPSVSPLSSMPSLMMSLPAPFSRRRHSRADDLVASSNMSQHRQPPCPDTPFDEQGREVLRHPDLLEEALSIVPERNTFSP
ncbi:hypothetical protein FJU08_12180 [Martelella alba]|uniref:Uncharacterized protein n=1 Tax=Martelella alba TaxID=2590451 RepID=A0A506UBQ1_9HYPH|nr:hypothetical protein [Martelella alba]TPW30079.1 hypothetical protein FJU08_12180 [Martelella alba]